MGQPEFLERDLRDTSAFRGVLTTVQAGVSFIRWNRESFGASAAGLQMSVGNGADLAKMEHSRNPTPRAEKDLYTWNRIFCI